MEKEKAIVFGTGLSGLVGSAITARLSNKYEFVNLDLSRGVDILDPSSIEKVLSSYQGKVLIHLAAFTDVNAAQQQDGDKSGSCWRVNVEGTANIVKACQQHQLHLIHFSTAYVFDGQQKTPYLESDPVNPVDWYSKTKAEAEKIVSTQLPKASILRISFPYSQQLSSRLDVWDKIAQTLKDGRTGPFFKDHFFTMTPLEWLVPVVDWAIETQPAGIWHTTTDKVFSDLSLAKLIANELNLPTSSLQSSSVREYNQKAERPYQPYLVLDNQKLKKAMGPRFPQENVT
jgi:dTDP-4-dehydrorhamnose reductase